MKNEFYGTLIEFYLTCIKLHLSDFFESTYLLNTGTNIRLRLDGKF